MLAPGAAATGATCDSSGGPSTGRNVTLYLDATKLTAKGKALRDFAAGLPGAETTPGEVRFAYARTDGAAILAAFAAWDGRTPARSATRVTAPAEPDAAARSASHILPVEPPALPRAQGRPRPPWESAPISLSPPPPPPPPALAAPGPQGREPACRSR